MRIIENNEDEINENHFLFVYSLMKTKQTELQDVNSEKFWEKKVKIQRKVKKCIRILQLYILQF